MYKSPMVEKSTIAAFFSKKFSPKGPMMTPEMISPITPGILNFLRIKGDSRIIKRIKEKTKTGLVSGSSNSCDNPLKNV
jgi:hypothetical protein